MYLGYQNEKIALVANTREELANNKFMKFDSIVESAEDYVLYEGEYITVSEAERRTAEAEKEAKRKGLLDQLDALDLKCIRALRAIGAGEGSQEDTEKLAALEAQAEEIRKELQLLNPVTEAE